MENLIKVLYSIAIILAATVIGLLIPFCMGCESESCPIDDQFCEDGAVLTCVDGDSYEITLECGTMPCTEDQGRAWCYGR